MRFDATLTRIALSAIGTIVVAVGAIVAVRQLRSIRHGNELATLTELEAQFGSPDLIEACAFVRTELAAAMSDPSFIAELRAANSASRARHVLRVANFFELIGIYRHYDALSEGMTSTIWGVVATRYWVSLREAIEVCREERTVFHFFEDSAVRSERWLESERFRTHLARLAADRRPAVKAVRDVPVRDPVAADEPSSER